MDQRDLAFFKELLRKSGERLIPWEKTVKDTEYIAALGGEFTVRIEFADVILDGAWVKKVRLTLKDSENREIVRIEAGEGVTENELRDLFELARRRALAVEEKIDRLMNTLKAL